MQDLATSSGADLAKPATADMAQATVGATVVLKDDFYMPNMVTITAGQKIQWTWQAAGAHGVDSVDNSFPDSPILNGSNPSYEHTFTTPGTYQVRCLVHGAQMPEQLAVLRPREQPLVLRERLLDLTVARQRGAIVNP